jgi:salicylate hydroxylase
MNAQLLADAISSLTKLIAMMRPNPQNWPTFQVKPIKKWVSDSGKFVLMGDAAHAMAFYLSMGQSILPSLRLVINLS